MRESGLADAAVASFCDTAVAPAIVLQPSSGRTRLLQAKVRDAADRPDNVRFGIAGKGGLWTSLPMVQPTLAARNPGVVLFSRLRSGEGEVRCQSGCTVFRSS